MNTNSNSMTDPCAQRWSTDADRAAWKREAAAGIKPLAEAQVARYHKHYLDNPQEQEALDAFFVDCAPDDDDESDPPTPEAWAVPQWEEPGYSEKWLREHGYTDDDDPALDAEMHQRDEAHKEEYSSRSEGGWM